MLHFLTEIEAGFMQGIHTIDLLLMFLNMKHTLDS